MIRAIPYTSLWVGTIFWAVLSAALFFATGWQLHEDYLFAHHSAATTATVGNRYATISHGRHGDSTNYHLTYHYQVGDVTAGVNTTVDSTTYDAVRIGSQIPVLYIIENIAHNRINMRSENDDRARALYITLALTALDLIIGTWMTIFYVRRNRLYRELFARGMQCQGLVTDVNFDLVGEARTPRYYFIFTFRDQQGSDVTGRTWYLRPGDETLWREQMPVSVYYDSRDARKFTVDLTRPKI